MYIVAYTTKDGKKETSEYLVFDIYSDAVENYNRLLQAPDLHSASIAAVMESTDYDRATEVLAQAQGA